MALLRRQYNMPDWFTQVMKEFTRPPYFLEHLYTKQKDHKPNAQSFIPSSTPSAKHVGKAAPEVRQSHKLPPRPRSGAISSAASSGRDKSSDSYDQLEQPLRRPMAGPPRRREAEFVATAMSQAEPVQTKSARSWQAVFRKANLPLSLTKAYGWNVRHSSPVANVVRVDTKSTSYVLKKTHIPPRRVEFLHQVLKYLDSQGFTRYAQFALTRQNRNPYAVRNQMTYYATEWIPGNPANFASLQQVGLVAQTLAQFHELTRGYEVEGYSPPMEYALSDMLRRRTEDLRGLLVRAEAHQPADDFDKLFLGLAPQLRTDAELGIRVLEDEKCLKFLTKDGEYPGLCHLDVIPGNFIYSDKQVMHVIDLDLATYAPRVLDLSHLLRRSLQRQNWRAEVAYACFVQYNDAKSICTEEYELVRAMLAFPYRAWRLAHTHYRVLADELQTEELQDYTNQEPRRQNFLTEYARQISGLLNA
jgi:CotS family spore coat protein